MKTLTKSLVAAVVLASSAGLATIVTAMPSSDGQGCSRGGHHMSHGRHSGDHFRKLDRMAERLNASDEQRAQIRAIAEGSRGKMDQLRGEMRTNRSQLKELIRQTPLDKAAVRGIAEKQGDLKTEMIVLRAQQRSEIKAVLTDDQRARLEQMRERKQSRGGNK